MKLSLFSVAAALVVALAGAAEDEKPVPPPDEKITLDVVSVNGSGCPPGTAVVAVAPDKQAFTVTYSSYMASAGWGSGPFDWRKNCQLGVQLNFPQGFTYAIAKADYRGFASLAHGAKAEQLATYYFQGESQSFKKSHTFNGPFQDNWQATDTTEAAAIVFHPCGVKRNLNLNTELRVHKGNTSPHASSFITMDSTDGSIKTVYHLRWKKCKK